MAKAIYKLENRYGLGLASWLGELQLVGKESRMRTRFINILSKRMEENQEVHNEIIKKFANKDDKGAPKRKGEGTTATWDIPEEKTAEADKEYAGLIEEELVIDVLEGNKEMLKVMREVVLNTSYVFGPKEGGSPNENVAKYRQSQDYEKWCESFEEMKI